MRACSFHSENSTQKEGTRIRKKAVARIEMIGWAAGQAKCVLYSIEACRDSVEYLLDCMLEADENDMCRSLGLWLKDR